MLQVSQDLCRINTSVASAHRVSYETLLTMPIPVAAAMVVANLGLFAIGLHPAQLTWKTLRWFFSGWTPQMLDEVFEEMRLHDRRKKVYQQYCSVGKEGSSPFDGSGRVTNSASLYHRKRYPDLF